MEWGSDFWQADPDHSLEPIGNQGEYDAGWVCKDIDAGTGGRA